MKLGFGLMRLPLTDDDRTHIDIEQVKKMADSFIRAGGTYFDTAYPYHNGKSEEAFKEAVVKRYNRSKYLIADKMPLFFVKSAQDLPKFFDEQINRCGVEYFDYYLLHCLDKENYAIAENTGAFEYVAKKKAEGKIKRVGFSFHDSPELLDEILTKHPEMEFVQLQINYLDWEDKEIASKRCYETARKHNKPIIVMEPIKGGKLANLPSGAVAEINGASPAAFALNFAASLDGVFMVLSGMSDIKQLDENVKLFGTLDTFGKNEYETAKKLAYIIRKSLQIPCTACEYCVPECPKKIQIPQMFSMYNEKDYSEYNALNSKASDCVKCGACEKMCPQHIEIRTYLEKIAKKKGE